ncbi:hypothetical protein RI367_004905 [Sorochytrium milnesiophthora]
MNALIVLAIAVCVVAVAAANTGSAAILFDFRCTLVNTSSCDYILRDISKAAELVTQSLHLVAPVVVRVVAGPQTSAEGHAFLGRTWISAYWRCDTDAHGHALLPQSLVKQLVTRQQLEGKLSATHADMDIQLNVTDTNPWVWWREQSPSIAPYQKDVSLLFVHELLHGLGFISFWTYHQVAGSLYMVPEWIFQKQRDRWIHTVYDALLIHSSRNIAMQTMADQLMESPLPSLSGLSQACLSAKCDESDHWQRFQAWRTSQQGTLSASLAAELSRGASEQVFVQGHGGEQVYVETAGGDGGTPFTHLNHTAYANTADFAVALSAGYNTTLQDMQSRYPQLIGPKTWSVLRKMGYMIKDAPTSTVAQITILDDRPYQHYAFSCPRAAITTSYISPLLGSPVPACNQTAVANPASDASTFTATPMSSASSTRPIFLVGILSLFLNVT